MLKVREKITQFVVILKNKATTRVRFFTKAKAPIKKFIKPLSQLNNKMISTQYGKKYESLKQNSHHNNPLVSDI